MRTYVINFNFHVPTPDLNHLFSEHGQGEWQKCDERKQTVEAKIMDV